MLKNHCSPSLLKFHIFPLQDALDMVGIVSKNDPTVYTNGSCNAEMDMWVADGCLPNYFEDPSYGCQPLDTRQPPGSPSSLTTASCFFFFFFHPSLFQKYCSTSFRPLSVSFDVFSFSTA